MTLTNPISTLQDMLVAKISKLSCFAGPPPVGVLSEKTSDLKNRIDQAIAKIGLSVFVATPSGVGMPHGRKAIKIKILVGENVVVNQGRTGTKLSAIDATTAIAAIIDLWTPSDEWERITKVGWELQELTPQVVYEITAETGIVMHLNDADGSGQQSEL
jgi:hypothetical protein